MIEFLCWISIGISVLLLLRYWYQTHIALSTEIILSKGTRLASRHESVSLMAEIYGDGKTT